MSCREDGARPDTSPVKLRSFVLCKYDEARRRGDIDDWTDHSDIGACFDGRILTAEEYQRTEDRYIAAADILARAAGASHFTLRNVFLHSPPCGLARRGVRGPNRRQDHSPADAQRAYVRRHSRCLVRQREDVHDDGLRLLHARTDP